MKVHFRFNLTVFCFAFISFLHSTASAQSWFEEWYGDEQIQYGLGIAETPDGFLVLSIQPDSVTFWPETVLTRINYAGDSLWTRKFDDCSGYDIIPTLDGNYIFVGDGPFLYKINAAGDSIWKRNYSLSWANRASHIMQMPDSSFVVTGSKEIGTFDSCCNAFIANIDPDGDINWFRTPYLGRGGPAIPVSATEFVIAMDQILLGPPTVKVMKYNLSATLLWERTHNAGTSAYGIAEKATGGFLVSGHEWAGYYQTRLLHLDSDGNLDSTQILPDITIGDEALAPAKDGGFFLAGRDTSFVQKSAAIYRLDANGNVVTKRYFNKESLGASLNRIIPTRDGGVAAVGTNGINSAQKDAYVIYVDSSERIFVSVEPSTSVEYKLTLYPNPTRGSILIDWPACADYGESASIRITDLSGREVLNQLLLPTSKQEINLHYMASGIYHCSLVTAEGIPLYHGKLVITRD